MQGWRTQSFVLAPVWLGQSLGLAAGGFKWHEALLRQEAGLNFVLDSRAGACNVLVWTRGKKRQRERGVEMKCGLLVGGIRMKTAMFCAGCCF